MHKILKSIYFLNCAPYPRDHVEQNDQSFFHMANVLLTDMYKTGHLL